MVKFRDFHCDYRVRKDRVCCCNACNKILFIQDKEIPHSSIYGVVSSESIVINPFLRVVFGTYNDAVRKLVNLEMGRIPIKTWVPFESVCYICSSCMPDARKEIVEKIESTDIKIYNGLHDPHFRNGYGCWFTMTEYIPNANGYYCNLQLTPKEFALLLSVINLWE